MSTLEVRLFGTLSIEREGRPLARFPSRRVQDLFSYLILNRDSVHSREYLAGLFWGDLDERKARHCLNTALWRLRRVLRPSEDREDTYLRVDARSIGFNTASNTRIDVAEFEARCALAEQIGPHARDQQAVLYQQAVALYREDLLVDCYDDWCLVERERLRHLYLRALSQLLTYHSERREHGAAIDCANRILAADPLREEIHRDLIRLYLASGQQAAALRQYRACESVLRRELGIAPMPETQSLLPKILGATGSLIHVSSRPASGTQGQALGEALRLIREATSNLERARQQLREASGMIEGVARSAQPPATATAPVPAPTVDRLQHVARLVADVAAHLGDEPGGDSCDPAVFAPCSNAFTQSKPATAG